MSINEVVVSDLTVVAVEGGGNTCGGRYFYSFTPDLQLVTTPARMEYRLSRDTPKSFRILALVTTDHTGQIQAPVVAADGRSVSFDNDNTTPLLVFVSIIVGDRDHEMRRINCDPQVVNIPD